MNSTVTIITQCGEISQALTISIIFNEPHCNTVNPSFENTLSLLEICLTVILPSLLLISGAIAVTVFCIKKETAMLAFKNKSNFEEF